MSFWRLVKGDSEVVCVRVVTVEAIAGPSGEASRARPSFTEPAITARLDGLSVMQCELGETYRFGLPPVLCFNMIGIERFLICVKTCCALLSVEGKIRGQIPTCLTEGSRRLVFLLGVAESTDRFTFLDRKYTSCWP